MNRKLNDCIDYVVRATDGDVGTVEQFYFDDLTWRLRYMAVKTRGPSSRMVLISLVALGVIDWDKHVFRVNLVMDQVRRSPGTDMQSPVSRRSEVELHDYYAWPVYWGGNFYVMPEYGRILNPADEAATTAALPSVTVSKLDPKLRSMRDVRDCRVHATDGHIGHVEDVLVDDQKFVIRYLVVNTRNWLPERRVLVSPQWITRVSWADKEVFVDLTREAVKMSPRFASAADVGSAYESQLRKHLEKQQLTEWVIFRFHAPAGADVHVAGTFNGWNPTTIKLGSHGKESYLATILLPVGRCEYKYVVNGEWCNGPDGERVPNAFGTTNNVLVVEHSTAHDTHLHTFTRQSDGQEPCLLGVWQNG